MKKGILALLIISILCISGHLEALAAPKELYAQSAVLMDADSGRVLFEKNGEEQRPMASTTKILTCILVLEQMNEGETAEASQTAAAQPKVRLGVRAGERYDVKDLLYSLMLESHNDAAVILAEHFGGSVEGFAAMMNEKAEEIGCEQYHFVTPNGLDGEDVGGEHSIAAEDLARIMRYCIMLSPKKAEFLEITRTPSYSFTDADGTRSYSCNNHNAFLGMMEGALSGKTGFTGKAGYCYVGALTRDGKTFIVALLACGWPNNRSYKWRDTCRLMEYGLENYEYRDVWETPHLKEITVENGIPGSGSPYDTALAEPVSPPPEEIRLLLRKDEQVTVRVTQKKRLTAPVTAGEVVGHVYYYLGDTLLRDYPITTAEAVEAKSFAWYLEWVLGVYSSFMREGG